jgi:hypothetical protein
VQHQVRQQQLIMLLWQAVQAVAGLVVAAVQAVIEQTQHLQLVQVVH